MCTIARFLLCTLATDAAFDAGTVHKVAGHGVGLPEWHGHDAGIGLQPASVRKNEILRGALGTAPGTTPPGRVVADRLRQNLACCPHCTTALSAALNAALAARNAQLHEQWDRAIERHPLGNQWDIFATEDKVQNERERLLAALEEWQPFEPTFQAEHLLNHLSEWHGEAFNGSIADLQLREDLLIMQGLCYKAHVEGVIEEFDPTIWPHA